MISPRFTSILYTFYRRGERISQGLRRRITEAGWFLLVVTFIIGLSGVDTQWSKHYQIFAILFMVLVLALLSLLLCRRPRLRAKRRLPRFATAGMPLRYPIDLQHTGRRAYRGLRFREWLEDSLPTRREFVERPEPRERERNLFDRTFVYYRWMWLREIKRLASAFTSEGGDLEAGSRKRVMMRLLPNRRGVLTLRGLRVLRQDVFGLFQRALRVPDSTDSLLILPRRYPVGHLELPGRRQLDESGQGVVASSVGQSEEFVGLRDYRPGDPPRHVHWRSWARLNRPVVKEFEDEHFPRYALALDTQLAATMDQEIFEEAVSVAASFVSEVETREASLDFLFVADRAYTFSMGGPGASRASEKMLEILATVEAHVDDTSLVALEQTMLRRTQGLSAAILVFTDWDAAREKLVNGLRAREVYTVALVVTEAPRESLSGVHFLPVGEIAHALSKLSLSEYA